MKRLFPVILLLSAVFFTSCIDYVQSISYKDGKYQLYYKITLSKVLVAMADEDPDEMFSEFNGETIENLPADAYVKTVNTDLEVGAEFQFAVDPKTEDENEKSYLPKTSKMKCYIPFLLGQSGNEFTSGMNSSDQEAQNITQAILSSAKCRILISKKILPSIEMAYFEGYYNQTYTIPVFDYGDSFCLEIPFIVLFDSSTYNLDRVVVIKELVN